MITVTGIPTLTASQMHEVDRVMTDELGIDLPRMMEHAGTHLARVALERFSPASVTILVGSGGNGGGGLVAARHLANRGITVTAVLSHSELAAVTQQQADILRALGIAFSDDPIDSDLVIDALIGYSLDGDPRGRVAELIEWANHQTAPVLALDLPSGLDATSGIIGDPCIRATVTMTLALPKTGLSFAPTVVGELYLGDIGVPPAIYRVVDIEVDDPFSTGPIVVIA